MAQPSDKNSPLEVGQAHTVALIQKYNEHINKGDMDAETAGKALMAAGVEIALRGTPRADIASMLRMLADHLEKTN